VTELRELAGGQADLLAEVAGIFEGTSDGELDEPLARQARNCAAWWVQIRSRPHTAAQRTAGEPTLTSTGLVARPVLRREQGRGPPQYRVRARRAIG
jgi:hypothetical protein